MKDLRRTGGGKDNSSSTRFRKNRTTSDSLNKKISCFFLKKWTNKGKEIIQGLCKCTELLKVCVREGNQNFIGPSKGLRKAGEAALTARVYSYSAAANSAKLAALSSATSRTGARKHGGAITADFGLNNPPVLGF